MNIYNDWSNFIWKNEYHSDFAEADWQVIGELMKKYPIFFKSKDDKQLKVASDEEISELLGMEA